MNARHIQRFLVLAIVGAALAGCASLAGRHAMRGPGTSPGNACGTAARPCEVTVLVTGCSSIVATPETLFVAKGATPVIQWKIDAASSAGFGFAKNNAIVLKTSPNPFSPRSSSSNVVTLANAGSRSVEVFEYGINTVDDKGSACPQLDPWVVNL